MSDKILDPRTYAEPVVEYSETELAVTGREIKPGDIRNGREVKSVKAGSKWVYLYDEQSKTIDEVKLDDVVPITRREATPDSAAVQYRALMNRGIAEKLATRNGPVRALGAKISEDLEKRGSVDAETLARLVQVQAELKVLNELAVVATRAEEGEDLVDVQHDFAEHLTHRLVRDVRHRAVTRTGTVTQNLIEDADRDAAADFIERVRWAH